MTTPPECWRCAGTGWLTAGADSDPMWECPECHGTGDPPEPQPPAEGIT